MAEEEVTGGPIEQPASGASLPPALPRTLSAAPTVESAPESSPEPPHHGILGRTRAWFVEEGPWWLCSFVFHIILVCSLALLGGKAIEKGVGEAPSFEEAQAERAGLPPVQALRKANAVVAHPQAD